MYTFCAAWRLCDLQLGLMAQQRASGAPRRDARDTLSKIGFIIIIIIITIIIIMYGVSSKRRKRASMRV